MLEQFIVDSPEAGNVLLASTTNAAVVSYMESKDITRETITVEVHCGRNLGASKADVFCPNGYSFFGGVTNMA
jgi:hypothetical protein